MTNVSKKLACTAAVGIWSIASMALAGQAKTNAPGCYEGGAQGKAVPTAKTQEECQKLGEQFTWMEASAHDHQKGHDHKAQGKAKGKVKQQAKTEAKSEVKPAPATEAEPAAQPAVQAAPVTEAPKK